MLAEHLKMYGSDPGKRGSSARVNTPAPRTAPPAGGDDVSKSGTRKTSSLVFLDLDEPRVAKGQKAPPPPPVAPQLPRSSLRKSCPNRTSRWRSRRPASSMRLRAAAEAAR